MRDRTLVLVNPKGLGKSLSLAVGVVVPFGSATGGELRADGDSLEEAGIGSGHVAPVEAHGLKRGPVRYVAPLLQLGVVGEYAVIGAVETACEHVGFRQAMVQGDSSNRRYRKSKLRVDDVPRNDVHHWTIGRNPTAHDAGIGFMANHGIGLAESFISDEADVVLFRSVGGDPADVYKRGNVDIIGAAVIAGRAWLVLELE